MLKNDLCLALPIKITNPHKKEKSYKTFGIVDTGATECYIPASIATMLEHNLLKGERKSVMTGNGLTDTYRHTFTLTVYHPLDPDIVIYTLEDVEIDCVPDLSEVLLGINGFLSNFKLKVDFANRTFSLNR